MEYRQLVFRDGTEMENDWEGSAIILCSAIVPSVPPSSPLPRSAIVASASLRHRRLCSATPSSLLLRYAIVASTSPSSPLLHHRCLYSGPLHHLRLCSAPLRHHLLRSAIITSVLARARRPCSTLPSSPFALRFALLRSTPGGEEQTRRFVL
ncbi:hypothetical protein Sjap_025795 [Stephania japonica]|uniref:Uncharacterized protein n=1 Tax=Stephania japonica TaxID=461633 RepID=A0AAP0E2F1_9MAGN